MAADWRTALVVIGTAALILQVSARAAIRRPERYFRVAFREGMATGTLVLVAVNLRYEDWMVFYRRSRWYDPAGDWPLWVVDVALVGMFVWLQLDMLRRDRRHRRGG
jgi:hypothetical protein